MHPDFPLTLRVTVQQLARTYRWRLLDEETLCWQVWQDAAANPAGAPWETPVTRTYATWLYAACHQQQETAQRAQAYTELHRYLYFNACTRYPHLSPEDLAQAAIQLVYQQIDRCHTPPAFFTFALFKLLQVAKTAQRRHHRQRNEDALDAARLETIAAPYSPAPLETIIQAERWQVLCAALMQVRDPRQRAVIQLKFFEELSDDEIGERLDLTANHVRVLRNRGLQQLRSQQKLQQYVEKASSAL